MSNRDDDAPAFQDVGRRLRVLRLVLDLSQVDIAAKMGIQTSRWNNWEVGLSLISPMEVRKLKRLLPGLTSDWIYDEDLSGITVALAEQLAAAANRPDPPKKRGRPSSRQ